MKNRILPFKDPLPLYAQMIALADAGHSRASELRDKAAALEIATKSADRADGFQVEQLLNIWRQARMCFRECQKPDLNLPKSWTKK